MSGCVKNVYCGGVQRLKEEEVERVLVRRSEARCEIIQIGRAKAC